jgi:hypothetical protein
MKMLLILSIFLISCTANVERSGVEQTKTKKNVANGSQPAIPSETKRDEANKGIVRLAPKEFTELPAEIVADLEKRGCTIPQSYMQDAKHNVIKGEFKKAGQQDIALLCSKDSVSGILIYWNKSAQDATMIKANEDKDRLVDVGDGRIMYDRSIAAIDKAGIERYQKEFDGPQPEVLDHDGIGDGYGETGSEIHYLDGDQWILLAGSD